MYSLKINQPYLLFFFIINLVGLVGCGSSNGLEEDLTITISAMSFSPTALNALAGDTITVINDDTTTHTVTSESSPSLFDNSGTFDTGNISPSGTTTFRIPDSATLGTIYYFYCNQHKSLMSTPNGTITIQN